MQISNRVALITGGTLGIGAAITHAAMQTARERGYEVAVLHATEMGLPTYLRLGFRELNKIPLYLYER